MVHAHAANFHLPLDAKRIAATAAVIALHVGVLMMLMMPAQVARTPYIDEAPPVPPDVRVEIPITPPPPIAVQPPPRQPTHTQVHEQVPIFDPPVESVDQTPSAVDFQAVDVAPVENTFDPGPPAAIFVQLATRIAPAPVYPRRAIALRLTGVVKLRIHVDAGGVPIEVSVEESSGHALLDEAAVKIVQSRWRFVPATHDGQAIDAWARVPIEFVLE